MDPTFVLLLGVGAVALLIGQFVLLIAAFRHSFWWGLSVLLLPLANLFFLAKHWAECKIGGAILILGLVVAGVGFAMAMGNPQVQAMWKGVQAAQQGDPSALFDTITGLAPEKALELEQSIRNELQNLERELAGRSAALDKRFKELNTQKASLNDKEPSQVAAFNAAVASYKEENAGAARLKEAVEQARTMLAKLEKSKADRVGKTSGPTNSSTLVMYTTNTCPACVKAKNFCAERGIPFQEKNIQVSTEAREEFKKLGGRGVPLLVMGNERCEGFNSAWITQRLR
jgi:glutaredoxin